MVTTGRISKHGFDTILSRNGFLDLLIDVDDPHWHGNVYVGDPDE